MTVTEHVNLIQFMEGVKSYDSSNGPITVTPLKSILVSGTVERTVNGLKDSTDTVGATTSDANRYSTGFMCGSSPVAVVGQPPPFCDSKEHGVNSRNSK